MVRAPALYAVRWRFESSLPYHRAGRSDLAGTCTSAGGWKLDATSGQGRRRRQRVEATPAVSSRSMGFEGAYRNGIPPWDIGRAQPAIVRAADEGLIAGAVIDVGCGTGENALHLASRGLAVVGVDGAPTAIARAQEKARLRRSSATFVVGDALALGTLGRAFDTAVDCGLFHTFSDADRVRFERSLHGTLRAGARYVLLCFSELEADDRGPHRVTHAEIRSTFATGWTIDSIVAERFAARLPGGGAHAWLATLTRT